MAAIHDTFAIERTYPKSVAKVFAAFSDPARKRRWYAEGGNEVEVFEMHFRVDGVETTRTVMSAQTPFPGTRLTNDAVFQSIVENERVVMTANMTLGDRRISTAVVTFAFEPAGEGSRLTLTHQAVFYEGSDGPEMRKAGWASLIDRLTAELADA